MRAARLRSFDDFRLALYVLQRCHAASVKAGHPALIADARWQLKLLTIPELNADGFAAYVHSAVASGRSTADALRDLAVETRLLVESQPITTIRLVRQQLSKANPGSSAF